MNSVVLDVSALLAFPLGEPWADRVKAALDGSLISVVTMAEVVSHTPSSAPPARISKPCCARCPFG